tara:strand:+ start:12926 stop:13960 length:1035 start_codon:yes stop_codon:yes gene_type:complete
MGLPQGFKKNVKFIRQKVGPEQRQDILDKIDYKGTYLPKGVGLSDIDETFIDFVGDDLEMEIDGNKIPVIFLTIQRWAEFSKTWTFADKFKNLKMPFITIVRQPHIQVGTNQNSMWNIPGNKLYTYLKVPTYDAGIRGVDTYRIPQPTSVDVTYDVRLFCNRMKDLNVFHTIIQTAFNSRQYYVKVKGHPMPVHLESIGDESQKDNFDKRRFYVQHFNMKLLGYILDEDDYEVVPSINRGSLKFVELASTLVDSKAIVNHSINGDLIKYNIIFKSTSDLLFNLNINSNVTFIGEDDLININTITYYVNNNIMTFPFSVKDGDVVKIVVTKNNEGEGSLNLIGNL